MFTSPQRHQFVASDAKGFGDSVQSTRNTVEKPGIDTSHTALLKGRQGFIKGAG